MCNCGVAVRAGRDVFVVSTCEYKLQIGYTQCEDGVLVVKQETDLTYAVRAYCVLKLLAAIVNIFYISNVSAPLHHSSTLKDFVW